mgnify:CR=1 FL=1
MPTRIQVTWATAHAQTEKDLLILESLGREPVTSKSFEIDLGPLDESGLDDAPLLERLFEETNLYGGPLWDAMQPLPEERTHTSISVGDYITIEDRMYRCAPLGWDRTDTFVPNLGVGDPVAFYLTQGVLSDSDKVRPSSHTPVGE